MDAEDFPTIDDYFDAMADHQGLCSKCFAPFDEHTEFTSAAGKIVSECPD